MAKASILFLIMLVFATPDIVLGEVYKYRNADGRWQFTDRPPPGTQATTSLEESDSEESRNSDLDEQLTAEFPPGTPVQRATLSVVAIKTPLASGAGFFISTDGYILTNKHVVRPKGSTAWRKAQKAIDEAEKTFVSIQSEVKSLKDRLKRMELEMQRLEALEGSSNGFTRQRAKEERARIQLLYAGEKKQYRKVKRALSKAQREFKNKRLDFSIRSNASVLQSSFRIVLKSGAKLLARLVATSKKHDLALLKLDGYKTPAIPISSTNTPGQGERVYAIGSPLGLADAMTSGVITGNKEGYVLTDAQILPGNSGGPLINEEGGVIAVNTAKVSGLGSAYGTGFGAAIPINVAEQEFAEIR